MKRQIAGLLRRFLIPTTQALEKQLVLQATLAAKHVRARSRLQDLSSAEFSAFSQWGEDGIIDWLLEQLPGIPQTFIEFGVEDYRESNTRLLLRLRNWRGLVIDGSDDHIRSIREQEIYWRYDLTAKCAFIDRDNINELIAASGLQGDIGLLSVDIDGNDYWVWEAIEVVRPVVLVCEYNAVFGDVHRLSVPYAADFQRTRAHHSNLYFGASLPALIFLGVQKGYCFLGTNLNGCNAFFVREDHASKILGAIDQVRSWPSRYREGRDSSGNLTFVRGVRRLEAIQHLPVVNIATGKLQTLSEIGNLYSPAWFGNQ